MSGLDGPWQFTQLQCSDHRGMGYVQDASGEDILHTGIMRYSMEQNRAIALAAAAAPQLLEALKGLLAADNADTYAIVGRDNDGHPLNAAGVARQKARAAIASATGEA